MNHEFEKYDRIQRAKITSIESVKKTLAASEFVFKNNCSACMKCKAILMYPWQRVLTVHTTRYEYLQF